MNLVARIVVVVAVVLGNKNNNLATATLPNATTPSTTTVTATPTTTVTKSTTPVTASTTPKPTTTVTTQTPSTTTVTASTTPKPTMTVTTQIPSTTTVTASTTPKPTTTVTTSTLPTTTVTASTTSASPPSIKYECFENGTIRIFQSSLSNFKNYAVGTYTIDQDSMTFTSVNDCSIQMLSPINNTDIYITGCSIENFTATVFFTKEATVLVFGGKHYYEYSLSCVVPDKGVTGSARLTAAAPALSTTTIPVTGYFNSISLVMTITPSSKVQLGDTLNVTISAVYKTLNPTLYIIPTKCDASNGKSNGTDYKVIHVLKNRTVVDPEVITVFEADKKGSATAKLYAFRFIDTNQVELKCDVRVCHDEHCGGFFKNRRRRSAEDTQSTDKYEVSAKYRINDGVGRTSGQPRVHNSPFFGVILLAATVKVMVKLH